MSRPVQFNNTIKFEGIPEGYMGEGFMATNFEKVVSLARKILSGPCLLQQVAVVLNLWQQWLVIMIWLGLDPKE